MYSKFRNLLAELSCYGSVGRLILESGDIRLWKSREAEISGGLLVNVVHPLGDTADHQSRNKIT